MTLNPKDKKQLKYAGIGLASVILVYVVLRKKTESGGSSVDPTGNGGTVPNSTVFSASKTAQKLYEAMKEMGTDEDLIFTALQNVSQAQFGQVVTAFGVQSYNPSTGNQVNFTPWNLLKLYGLAYWLKNELESESYDTLRLKYQNYL